MIDILVDELTSDGMRHVKVVSDIADPQPLPFPLAGAKVERKSDALLGLHYVEAWWEWRGFVDVHFEGLPKKFRRLAVWKFTPGERVSETITVLAQWYFEQTKHRPEYAWMKSLPRGVESGVEVDGVMLFQADWALPGCVMIGG